MESVHVLTEVGQGEGVVTGGAKQLWGSVKLPHKMPEATTGEQCPGCGVLGWGQNQCFHPEEVSISKGIKES